MTLQSQRQPKFEIDGSVVYELGEKLISDEVQALVELVKNCYDADASYANVTVETEKLAGDISPSFPQARGYLVIEDDGSGMDWAEIKGGWLTISASPKRAMKEKKGTTGKGRTPLGDKGLGRLGSQRLGRNIEIWTTKEGSRVEYYVGVNWGDFGGRVLSKVPVYFEEHTPEKTRKGTRIVISGLQSTEKWQGVGQGELVRKLSQLLFPFEELRPFEVFLSINGTRIDLDSISRRVFDVADAQFSFCFDGRVLHIEGRYRTRFLLATTKGEYAQQQFERLVGADQGAGYYAYLTQKKPNSIPGLRWEDATGWFVSFTEDHVLGDLGGVKSVGLLPLGAAPSSEEPQRETASPGPFRGVIYSFTRRGADLSAISDVFSLQDEFSKYVERHSGIRVFRDGFGVRPFGLDGNDWLQLGSGWTSAVSYYGPRPANVIGYVALTAKDNPKLEEATDREGFVESAHSENFYLLMRRVIGTITAVNTNLRRGYNDYVKTMAEQEAGVTTQDASEVFSRIREAASASRDLEVQVTGARGSLEAVHARVQALVEDMDSTPLFYTEHEQKLAPILQNMRDTLNQATSVLRQIETVLPRVRKLGEVADMLEPDLEHLREELEMFSELAGLGLTAEALSHEMSIIADGLAARTKGLLVALRERRLVDPEITSYTEHVHTSVGRMRKQLSHLDPSLRYVREERDRITVRAFFDGIRDFYSERFARNGLEIVIQEPFDDFTILMNRGKLTQVVDNLVLNSEYWLVEDLRKHEIAEPAVVMRAKTPVIEIYDTGYGVAKSVEHYLFQPFVTTKPRGRGLGLFIARQLLESSGCSISLLPERNQFDRRYIFRLDLAGVVADG